MPPTAADKKASYQPPDRIPFLYQRHRSHIQGFENLNLRPVPPTNHDSSRKDPYGGENLNLHRIYPRQMYVTY